MLHMLLASGAVQPNQLRSLRLLRCGSASLPPELARRIRERFGVPVVNSYGQTETCGEVIGWSQVDIEVFSHHKAGAAGRPQAGVEIEFVDENLRPVAAGEVGELCVRSGRSASGSGESLDPDRFTPRGYLRTGDLGLLDPDGFVWLVGRRSDVIVCGGFKMMPEEIERALQPHPGIADVMVVGESDDRLGEIPVAYVVPDEVPAKVPANLAAELISYSAEHLAKYKVPRRVELVEALPRTELGKFRRHIKPAQPSTNGRDTS
jgi:acyl-coenzyme A synthetase/AMP-(fatty) acid ligase